MTDRDAGSNGARRLRRGRPPEPDRARLATRVDAMIEGGMTVADACRALGVAPTTYYRWRAREDAVSASAPAAEEADVRTIIVEAARTVFREQGFDISLSVVAEAAGVSRQTLYNLFGSKKVLLLDVLRAVYATLLVLDHEPDGSEPLEETLQLFGRRYLDMAVNPDALSLNRLAISQYGKDPEVSGMIFALARRNSSAGLRDRLAAYLRKLQRRKAIGPGDPRLIADSFQSAILGMARLRALAGVEQSEARLHAHLACTVRIFADGLTRAG